MSKAEELKLLIAELEALKQREGLLKIQAATHGSSVDPSVLMEIEQAGAKITKLDNDIKATIAQMPPLERITNGITDIRLQIATFADVIQLALGEVREYRNDLRTFERVAQRWLVALFAGQFLVLILAFVALILHFL